MKSLALRKVASIITIYGILYILAAFATFDMTLPLKAFDYIFGRAMFAVATVVLFYVLPPIDELLEAFEPSS